MGKQLEDPLYLPTMQLSPSGGTAGMVLGPRASVGLGLRRLCVI